MFILYFFIYLVIVILTIGWIVQPPNPYYVNNGEGSESLAYMLGFMDDLAKAAENSNVTSKQIKLDMTQGK